MKKGYLTLFFFTLFMALPCPIFSQTTVTMFAATTDTDGDGITDDIDIDDDNDGILDTVECPSCFYTQQESEQVINVTTDFVLENPTSHPISFAFDGINEVTGTTNFTGLVPDQYITETESSIYEITPRNPIRLKSARFFMDDIAFTYDRIDEDGDGDIDQDPRNRVNLQGWTGTAWENLDGLNNRLNKNSAQNFTNTIHPYTVYSKFRITGIGQVAGVRVREIYLYSRDYNPSDYPKTTALARDTDGNNIPDYLDLDSDGDGCSDSVEAQNTLITANNISTYNTGTDTNNNGLLDIFENGTSGSINYKSNYTNAALNANINACLDTDGDGISDVVDIDDDNDGVLDIDEGGTYLSQDMTSLTWRGDPDMSVSTPDSNTISAISVNREPDVINNWQASLSNQTFALPLDLTFTYTQTSKAVMFGFSPESTLLIGGHAVYDAFGFYISGGDTNIRYNHSAGARAKTTSAGDIHRITIDENGLFTIYINNIIVYSQAGLPTDENYKICVSASSGTIKELQNINFSHRNSVLYCDKDSDLDGIKNNLDLDSDADGCSDSIEAGNTNHHNNNTTTYNTGDDLNKNGLLDIFENGATGTINYSSTYSDFATNTSINACTDTDNDDITNVYDIDDDNDGVLDHKELENCLVPGVKNDFSEYNGLWLDDSGQISNPQYISENNGEINVHTNHLLIGQTLPVALTLPLSVKWHETDKQQFWLNLYPYSDIGAFDPYYKNPDAIALRSKENSSRILPIALIDISDNSYYGSVDSHWEIKIFDANDGTATVQLWEIDTTGNPITLLVEKTGFPIQSWALALGQDSTIELEIESPAFDTYDFCDQDNDTISNHLDLDSDGDGCADAMEAAIDRIELQDATFPDGASASENAFIYGQVAGPYGANGLANSIESDDTKTATINTSVYTPGTGLNTYNSEALDATISTACYIPTSINFDGVDDFTATKSFLSGTQDVTLMAWVKRDPSISTQGYIAGEELFNITIDASGIAQANLITNSSSTNYQTNSTSTLEKGIWYHLTAVYSGTHQTLKLYVNGALESTNTSVPSSTLSTEAKFAKQHFSIGGNDTDDIDYFFGAIDEVRAFNLALTEDQIQQMVYQEIENIGDKVTGTIIPKSVEDSATNTTIPWNNLQVYYNMATVNDGKTIDVSNYSRDLILYNITTAQEQSAPMPYQTKANGQWNAAETWLHGDVWDITNQDSNKDWSIVNIKNKVTSNKNHNNLGFIVDTNAQFVLEDSHALVNSSYLELNGIIDLLDDSQLIQTTESDLVTSNTGKILRRQEGHSNAYRYNYWGSPVGTPTATSLIEDSANTNNPNNSSFKLKDLKDASENIFQFTSANNQTGKISTRWTYTFLNGITYNDWFGITQETEIAPGVGYTQKGTGNTGDTQQYIFEGRPNNGTIYISATDVPGDSANESENAVTLTTTLIGNPYPSSLDTFQFIDDNQSVISGTLYVWEQWAGNSHVLNDYQGGYATINKTGSLVAYQFIGIEGENDEDIEGVKIPTQYLPVGQGFMTEIVENGNIIFNNKQRVFKTETANESIFLRTSTNSSDTENTTDEDAIMKLLKLNFTLPNNVQREIAIGFSDITTDGFDYGYDGKMFELQANDLYTRLNDENMSIQAFKMFNDYTQIPLVYSASEANNFSISASLIQNFNPEQAIYLKDASSETYFDLRTLENYSFSTEAGTFSDRFSIVFREDSVLNTGTDLLLKNTLIYVNSKEKKLYAKNFNVTAKSIQLFNTLGQSVLSQNNVNAQTLSNTGIDVSKLSAGTYIVQLHTKDNNMVSKKVVIN